MNTKLIKEIAEWCVEKGLENTTSGSYYIYFDDIAEEFSVDVELIKENAENIMDEFDYDKVSDADIEDDSFSLFFYLNECCKHCSTYQNGNRCSDECEGICDIWCDDMDEDYETPVIEEFDKSERENLKTGDIAYCSYIHKVNVIKEIKESEDITLYQLDGWGASFHEKFIRKATETEIKWYNAELEAKQWLKDRQEELKDLTFRCFDTDLWREQKELLREAGYFVYDLRDWDEGNGYNIEHYVCVNHIGCWVTDIDLSPYMNDERWIGIDELKYTKMNDIPYEEIKEYLDKGKELHFNK